MIQPLEFINLLGRNHMLTFMTPAQIEDLKETNTTLWNQMAQQIANVNQESDNESDQENDAWSDEKPKQALTFAQMMAKRRADIEGDDSDNEQLDDEVKPKTLAEILAERRKAIEGYDEKPDNYALLLKALKNG